MNEIFITNHNDFDHQDRFDGQDYFFPKGERITVPLIAAEHMFGFGREDKTENLIRCGWGNLPEGVKFLANFVFTKGIMVEAPAEPEQPDLIATGGTLSLPSKPRPGDKRPAA